jgi:hypothetical protein
VNERLATHYGIANVKGVNFQRVALPEDSPRRGLLGKGSILTVTALPNRTSPVVRGKWVLQNLLGAPPPDPPPNVPALEENGNQVTKVRTTPGAARTAPRQSGVRLVPQADGSESASRSRASMRSASIEPTTRTSTRLTTPASMPMAPRSNGLVGLRQVLVNHSDQFLATVTKTLLTYALGRGVEYYDAPAVRSSLHDAAPQDYRFSSIISASSRARRSR